MPPVKGQGQLTCSHNSQLFIRPLYQVATVEGTESIFLTPCLYMPPQVTSKRRSRGASSPRYPSLGLVLLCCPGKMQGPLSQGLQLVRERDSSPALMTLGSSLLTATGGEGQGGNMEIRYHPYTHATSGQMNGSQLSCAFTSNSRDWHTYTPCSAMLCCTDEVQGLICPVLLMARSSGPCGQLSQMLEVAAMASPLHLCYFMADEWVAR